MKDRLTTAPLPLDRPQCSCGTCIVRWQEILSPVERGFFSWGPQRAMLEWGEEE